RARRGDRRARAGARHGRGSRGGGNRPGRLRRGRARAHGSRQWRPQRRDRTRPADRGAAGARASLRSPARRVGGGGSSRRPASVRSLNGLATLGIRQGHEILVSAHGPQAAAALDALGELAARDFDEEPARVAAPAMPLTPGAVPAGPTPDATLTGLPGAPGIVSGPARHLCAAAPEIPTGSAGDAEAEWAALQAALEQVRTEIGAARESVAARAGEYSAAIFDAHLLFLEDDALLGPARRAIFEDGRNAAEAWHAASEAVAADYRSLDDDY